VKPPYTGISIADGISICDALNGLLADEFVLMTQTKFFHWTVEGPDFYSLHLLFDSQHAKLSELVDLVGEAVVQSGGTPVGTNSQIVELTQLKEYGAVTTSVAMISLLLENHEAIMRSVRSLLAEKSLEKAPEVCTLLEDLLADHSKMAWFLRASQS
jgi:starvation-inducible DNA-binding protein